MTQANTAPAWFDLAPYGLIAVSGTDAARLLQGQLTAEIEGLPEGEGLLAALCQPQGRVLSLFRLFRTKSGFYLSLPADLIEITLNTLKKYAVFYKVTLTHENSSDVVFALTVTPTDKMKSATKAIAPCQTGLTYLLGDPKPLREALADWGKASDLNHYHDALITRLIPELCSATSGQFVPHDLNLIKLGAVSLTKGCYTGQEIITRMQHRATLKKHCHIAKPPHPVNCNEAVYIEKQSNPVGTIINATESQALMLVDDDAIHRFTLLTSQQHPYQLLTQVQPS